MESLKTLSIIIPTYNMERYLPRCLNSLVNAVDVLPMLEVLVINDGSKDASSQIAHQYQKRYPNSVIVIDKENGNYGSCVNRGLKEATGKYIKVLDADDWFQTNRLRGYVELLSSTSADLVLSDYDKVDENGKTIQSCEFDIKPEVVLDFTTCCTSTDIIDIQMHAVAYRKAIFEGLDYHQTEGISYTDQEWIFKPMSRVRTLIYYNKPLYMYLRGREGQTVDMSVLAKNIGQDMKMTLSLIKTFSTMGDLGESLKKYLTHKICSNVKFIYCRVLLDKAGTLSLLDDYDKTLSSWDYVYRQTDKIVLSRFMPFKVIRYYRDKRRYLPWYVVMIYRFYKALMKKRYS